MLSAAFSLGLMEAVAAETAAHLTAHPARSTSDQTLAQLQTVRLDFARMRAGDRPDRAPSSPTPWPRWSRRADAMLRVLEVKAVAAEAALQVTDLAMKLCGGAAFRKELGIERRFRDARAARVMAPTTDALLDFVGRATLRPATARGRGRSMTDRLVTLGAVAYDPKVVTIWTGFRDWFLRHELRLRLRAVLALRAPGGGPARRPHPRRLELAAGVGARAAAGRGAAARMCRRWRCATPIAT